MLGLARCIQVFGHEVERCSGFASVVRVARAGNIGVRGDRTRPLFVAQGFGHELGAQVGVQPQDRDAIEVEVGSRFLDCRLQNIIGL